MATQDSETTSTTPPVEGSTTTTDSTTCSTTNIGPQKLKQKRPSYISTLLGTANPDDFVFNPIIHEVRDKVYRKNIGIEDLGCSTATKLFLKDLARVPDVTDFPSSILASRIINYHLKHFLAYDEFNYEDDEASHEWMAERIPVKDLCDLIDNATTIVKKEPTLLRHESPVILLGDLHGNYKDLMHFVQTFGVLQFEIATSKLQFLGDYVDRGPHSIETITFILALKVRYPDKIFMLRGNHETSEVNCNFEHYGDGCFLAQCIAAYGKDEGTQLATRFNAFFDILPLAAVIDKKVFCVHGGLPRALGEPNFNLLQRIEAITRPPKNDEFFFDMLWADPATEEDEYNMRVNPDSDSGPKFPKGWGQNTLRGGDTCIFGKKAVDKFFEQSGCTHIVRAHQFPKLGIQLSKGATTLTLFSSSHYDNNLAAALLVYDHKLSIVIIDGKKFQAADSLPLTAVPKKPSNT